MELVKRRGLVLGGLLLLPACSCVWADTLVRTPEGERRLGDLRIGDAIFAFDLGSGVLVASRVIARRSAWRECVRIRCGENELVCTPDHPVYSPQSRRFEPASHWVDGRRSSLLVVEGEVGIEREVTETERFVGVREVIDVTVDHPDHAFVAANVVVHNKEYTTQSSGTLEGPEFELTATEPLRTFSIRSCINDEEPLDPAWMRISIRSSTRVDALEGPMWFAAYVEADGEVPFVDRESGLSAEIEMHSLEGTCTTPLQIGFERLDGYDTGIVGFSWDISVEAEPPPNGSVFDDVEIEVEEIDDEG